VSAEAVFDQVGPVMTRWTMGGAAAGLAPGAWKDAIGDSDASEMELRLLALTGQYLGLCVAPTPASTLTIVPDIPALALPLLPPVYAPLARRCLKALKECGGQRDLICLLATRGCAIHPADWMPSRHDDLVPDVYAPWRDWAEGQAGDSGPKQDGHDELTETNWSDWWPSARRIALAQIRSRDPARATALLAAKAAGETADARLRLIECLIPNLSEADAAYLESLSADRAPKIKALAASLLARLGRGTSTGEDAAELAGFFEVQSKGLLRRTRVLVPRSIKTPAQRSRRDSLFAQVDFESFARALGVSPDDLVALWPFGNDAQADHVFATFTEQSASAHVINVLCARLMAAPTINVSIIIALKPRLAPEQRLALARRLLTAKGGNFGSVLLIIGAGAEMDGLMESEPGKMLANIAASDGEIVPELRAIALIASSAAARAALDRLVGAGLTASDPRLDLLRLNAALNNDGVNG
jgi:Family of unknown function (DUF5691)